MCPHGHGGQAIADIFRTRGKGQFFTILSGCPLWTAPYPVYMFENEVAFLEDRLFSSQ